MGTYALHTLAGLAHGGCEECEDDGRTTGVKIWDFVSRASAAFKLREETMCPVKPRGINSQNKALIKFGSTCVGKRLLQKGKVLFCRMAGR